MTVSGRRRGKNRLRASALMMKIVDFYLRNINEMLVACHSTFPPAVPEIDTLNYLLLDNDEGAFGKLNNETLTA